MVLPRDQGGGIARPSRIAADKTGEKSRGLGWPGKRSPLGAGTYKDDGSTPIVSGGGGAAGGPFAATARLLNTEIARCISFWRRNQRARWNFASRLVNVDRSKALR